MIDQVQYKNFSKQKSKAILHRSYKHFRDEKFRADIDKEL